MKWGSATLRQLSVLGPQYGANASAIGRSGKRPRYIRITDIRADGKLLDDGAMEADLDDEEEFKLIDGDLLFARSGNTVGKVYHYKATDGPCVFAGYLIRFRLNRDLVNSRYAFYFTQSNDYRQWITRKQRVGGQPNVNGAEYAGLSLPLAPITEQRRIVELLEQADLLRQQRAEANQMADRLLPALFHKMFGDAATNAKGWRQHILGDVILEAAYGTSVSSNTDEEGLPVLRMNNITTDGRIDTTNIKHITLGDRELARQKLRGGDLLFNRTNTKELVGKTGLWRAPFPAVAASYLIRLRVDVSKVLPDYVWAWMNTAYFKQRLFDISRRAVGMANINATELRSMPILVPDMPCQNQYAERLAALEKLAEKRAQSAHHLESIFATMLHRAFTGELTAKWREAHMKELLAEIEHQARMVRSPNQTNLN